MPSWFAKVFKGTRPSTAAASSGGAAEATQETASVETFTRPNPVLDDEEIQEEAVAAPRRAEPRKVIEPDIISDEAEAEGSPTGADSIRIKAAVADDHQSCTFMVDRPVFENYSLYLPNPSAADGVSPLGEALFQVDGVAQVEIYNMNVTVRRGPWGGSPWEDMAHEIGGVIREHLESGKPVVTGHFLDQLPSEEEIAAKLEQVIQTEINPSIAAHSGAISLNRVEGNTVFINMMGGCQGCAASDITLKMGIHQAFREAVPQIGAILDETDHSKGTNPFYKTLPEEMRFNA